MQTLKRVEDAKREEDELWQWFKAEEGQDPACPEEAAKAPHAEESHTVLPPLFPAANLPEN